MKLSDLNKIKELRDLRVKYLNLANKKDWGSGFSFGTWEYDPRFFKYVKKAAADAVKDIESDMRSLGVEP